MSEDTTRLIRTPTTPVPGCDTEDATVALRTILFGPMHEKPFKIPTVGKFLYSAISNGIISYVGGNPGEITYLRTLNSTRDQELWEIPFDIRLWNYLQLELRGEEQNPKLTANVRKTITTLLEPHPFTHDPEPYMYSTLLPLLASHLGKPTCLPAEKFVSNILAQSNGRLTPNDLEKLVGIGNAARQFLDEGTKYIEAHYRWPEKK